MKYTSYKSTLDEIHRAYRQQASTNKKDRKKITLKSAFKEILENDPSFIVSGIVGRKAVTEWNWIRQDKQIIFPKDEAICRSIFYGKYEVDFIQSIVPFAEEFIINFPKSLKLEGLELPSVLVGFYQGDAYPETKIQPVLDDLGISDLEEYIVKDATQGLHLEVFFKRFDNENNKWATHRFFSPWDKLKDVLKTENVNFYRDSDDGRKLGDEVETTEFEDKLQFLIIRFIVSLLVYAQATDNQCFQEGLPGLHVPNRDIDDAIRKAKFNAIELVTVSTLEQASNLSSTSHYRSWHIRQLRDGRYYQNEYKDLKPGSRLVFVKDSFINKDIRPQTLVDYTP